MNAAAPRIALALRSEAASLRAVRDALRGFAADAALPFCARELDEVGVALHEACTNAIRHAHAGDASRIFRVEMLAAGDVLEIVVKDGGPPFDLDAVRAPAPDELQEGGYGIAIMRSWMDEVKLAREDGGNAVRLVRRARGGRHDGDGEDV